MMVVPTQSTVRLHYGRTWTEWSGLTLTLGALVLLLVPATRLRMRTPGVRPPTIVPWIERTVPERHHALMRRLARFGVVSVLATTVDLGSFNVLLAWSSLSVLASATVSYMLGLGASYLLNRWFTFPGRGRHSRTEEITAFTLISLVGLGLNNGAVALAAGVLGEGAFVLSAAKIVAAAVVWLVKFGMIQRWVFPARHVHPKG
jgi:putative flippase GtrA